MTARRNGERVEQEKVLGGRVDVPDGQEAQAVPAWAALRGDSGDGTDRQAALRPTEPTFTAMTDGPGCALRPQARDRQPVGAALLDGSEVPDRQRDGPRRREHADDDEAAR